MGYLILSSKVKHFHAFHFWAQSLEFCVKELSWTYLCKVFFVIDLKGITIINCLDSSFILGGRIVLVTTITNRFIDGLRDDIRAV
jgi:hypothetical protein